MPYHAAEVKCFLSRRESEQAQSYEQADPLVVEGDPAWATGASPLVGQIPAQDASPGQQAARAFAEVYRRLEHRLADRWIGAFARLAVEAPVLSSGVSAAEETANGAAVAFIRGEGSWSQFRWALRLFEAGLTAAADFLDEHAASARVGSLSDALAVFPSAATRAAAASEPGATGSDAGGPR